MDMNISSPASHQSTSAQPHTTAVNSPIITTPKGKGKKKKNKHIIIFEEDIDKDFRFPVDSKAESTQALSFQLPPRLYMTRSKKLKSLQHHYWIATLGNVISISTKRQRKYKMVQCKLVISEFFQYYEAQWMAPLAGIPTR
ncbi:hypothetical protein RclHR1_33700001 [Rhizophagus clarus]|uniref:Uncharacterized protein n=1 Tax=Rhizophagus clarus TaxID=94130 RepID=A0A2Z6RDB9_9GLOM|nr:hypothetical protein RclHR1_33700001 [Rhizophagus clarus]